MYYLCTTIYSIKTPDNVNSHIYSYQLYNNSKLEIVTWEILLISIELKKHGCRST